MMIVRQFTLIYIHFSRKNGLRLKVFSRSMRILCWSAWYLESALPLLNLLDVLTVNDIYRLHILKFTHLWHKGLLPVLFQRYFQCASSIHGYNTRYASKQNLYKPKKRTNSGKQTVASVHWDNIPVDLKNLNVSSIFPKHQTIICCQNNILKLCRKIFPSSVLHLLVYVLVT